MSDSINEDNDDEIFWNTYLQFPMDDLLYNADELQQQSETELDENIPMDTSTSIENYLNKDLFPILELPDECKMEIHTNTILETSGTMEHALPQFVFAIDKIPPFYFLLQAEKPKNLENITQTQTQNLC